MMFKCPNSYCIPWSYVCDGKWHCAVGADEMKDITCGQSNNCKFLFSCVNSTICIHLGTTCDEEVNCPLSGRFLVERWQQIKETGHTCKNTLGIHFKIKHGFVASKALLGSHTALPIIPSWFLLQEQDPYQVRFPQPTSGSWWWGAGHQTAAGQLREESASLKTWYNWGQTQSVHQLNPDWWGRYDIHCRDVPEDGMERPQIAVSTNPPGKDTGVQN